MEELIDKVQKLVSFELERANTIHPPKFNSYHEAYAVILEEFEEMTVDAEKLKSFIGILWNNVKHDREKDVVDWLKLTEERAEHMIAEAIQVAAMCRKARM